MGKIASTTSSSAAALVLSGPTKNCAAGTVRSPLTEVSRAYETAGRLVEITDADLEQLPITSTHRLEVQRVIPAKTITPVEIGRAYYVHAQGSYGADRAYILLRDALNETDRVAIGRISLRGRERRAMLRPAGDILLMNLLYFPDEVRDPSGLAPPQGIAVRPEERHLARTLIESLAADDLGEDESVDHYRQAVERRVEAKLAGHQPETPPPKASAMQDLATALEESVQRARRAHGGNTSPP